VSSEKKWYVVYTKPRWEKKVASNLLALGVEHYCPLNRVHKQWSDRIKVVKEPLFKGYVFLSPDEEKDKWDIKKVDGIINYVHWLGKPAIVKQREIKIIQQFLNEFDDVTVEHELVKKNERVLVKNGLMMNYKGLVLEVIDNKAKVQIESMGLALTAIFERKNLKKIS
jgi:transcription antitermination factor NusG